MSDPVGLYARLITAMRAGDDNVTLKFFDPGFVAYEDPGMPYGGVFRGPESFIKLRRKVYDTWGAGCLKLLFTCGDPDGDHAAAYFKLVGRPAGTSEVVEDFVTVVWTFRNDLAVEARVFYFDTPRLCRALRANRDLSVER